MQKKYIKILDLLHISGSIASIVGILIVLLEKTITDFNLGYAVGYFFAALMIISILSITIALSKLMYIQYIYKFNIYFKFSTSSFLFMLIVFFNIISIRLIIDTIIPFSVLIIMGSI